MFAFFLASNGLLYRNPLIRGDGYLMIFDGCDEPELVIASDVGPEPLDGTRARMRAVSILEQSGLSAFLSGAPRRMLRAFDEAGTETHDCYCFWLTVEAPIPAELCAAGSGVRTPDTDAAVYAFGCPWGESA